MRRYTRHELEGMDIVTLKAICRELKIKPETMSQFDDKDAMVQIIYKYRGEVSERFIKVWDEEKVNNLNTMLALQGEEQKNIKIDIPAYLKIYKGLESLNEGGGEYKVYTDANIDMTSALLLDQSNKIQGVIDVLKSSSKNIYFLRLRENMLNRDIKPGVYRNFKIIFFPNSFDKVLQIYNLNNESSSRFLYIAKNVREIIVEDVEETDDVLVIDYGTSYSTAGTYTDNKIKHVWFYSEETCLHAPNVKTRYASCKGCGRCALCPSVVAVKECKDNEVLLVFGHEAKNRMPMARNSIFYDTKRWVSDYSETINVKDLDGKTALIKRSEIIERFLKYIIHRAELQNKVKYKRVCFTSPVKQKAMSINMYKDILKDYIVEEKDSVDEAVAVVYDSVSRLVEGLEYEDGYQRSVLLIDCGGSTSDMVKCDFTINKQKKRSNIDIEVRYANGDTNFGGNNLTYRIMQYIKIKLSQYYKKERQISIDGLFNFSYYDIFDYVDTLGVNETYRVFEEEYNKAGNIIPTNFDDYINDSEQAYFNVRGNFYFLWNLAESIKVALYSSSSAYEYTFESLKASKSMYVVSVKNEKDSFATYTECPDIRILRDEINLLLKPEIYNLLKKFIEPFYVKDETMCEITNIMLSGQTTKIDIFRDVLKEYIAGHKVRAPFEYSFAKKLKCIKGAVAYEGAKAIGRIRTDIRYKPAVVPYYLTVETFDEDKEKTLIRQGQLLSDVYSYIDRTFETKIIVLNLRNHERDVLQVLKFNLNKEAYRETGYYELLEKFAWLKQGDIDRIEDGEIRIFIYSDDESWGFKKVEIANNGEKLYCGDEKFVPFESVAWEKDFFDGKR